MSSLDKVTDNPVVTGSDGGRSAANLNYILYLVGFLIPITAIVGVALAYSNRGSASDVMRTHFDWQIKIFWRTVRFFIALTILFFFFSIVAVLTLGLGFVLYLIPLGIWVWWAASTLMRVISGMKALGLGQPIAFYAAVPGGGTAAVAPAAVGAGAPPAPVVSMPPAGWYGDGERPGHTRWWDGSAWGMRDDEYASTATPARTAAAESVAPALVASPAVESDAEPAREPDEPQPRTSEEPALAVAAVDTSAGSALATTAAAPETSLAPARFCENCGAARSPTGRFCTACGSA